MLTCAAMLVLSVSAPSLPLGRSASVSFDEAGATVNLGDERIVLAVAGFGRDGRLQTDRAEPWRCQSQASPTCESIERRYGRLVHWFKPVAGEVEEGFTFDSRPAGAGPLLIDLQVSGATYDAGALFTAGGAMLGYDRLEAWDATGRRLPIDIQSTGRGVRVIVDDSGATYPLVVDPMISPEPISTLSPPGAPCEAFAAGDMDGDELAETAVVTSDAVLVYRGRHMEDGLIESPEWTLSHSESFMIATAAGDVDGDGRGDLILTAPDATETEVGEGRAWLYLGSDPLSTDPAAAWAYAPGIAGARLGRRVVANLDINGDGNEDVVFAAPNQVTTSGAQGVLYVFHGSPSGFSSEPDATIEAADGVFPEPADVSIVAVPDLDGDGRDELAWARVTTDAAYVDLFLGTASGFSDTPDQTIEVEGSSEVPDPGDFFAIGAGDFDGDGRGDLVAQSWTRLGDAWIRGIVGHAGGDDGFEPVPSWRFADPTFLACELLPEASGAYFVADSHFGRTIELADLDGTGTQDVIVSGTAAGAAETITYFIPSPLQAGLARRVAEIRTAPGRVRVLGEINSEPGADVALHTRACQIALHAGSEGVCGYDADGDTICDEADNCYTVFNPGQADGDDDGVGDACSERAGDCAQDEGTGGGGSGGLEPIGETTGGSTSADTGGADSGGVASTTGAASSTSRGGGADEPGGLGNAAAETGCSCSAGSTEGALEWLGLGLLGLFFRRRSPLVAASLLAACATEIRPEGNDGSSGEGGDATSTSESAGTETGDGDGSTSGSTNPEIRCCAEDGSGIVDCATGESISSCTDTEACDPQSVTCVDGCALSSDTNNAEGCHYYAMTASKTLRACFAVAISNNWTREARITVRYRGEDIDLSRSLVATRNASQGGVYDELIPPGDGILPGSSALLLLQGGCGAVAIGGASAVSDLWPDRGDSDAGQPNPSLRAHAIEIRSDMPVTAHQYMSYASSHAGGTNPPLSGSLLLAVPSWQHQFITHAVTDGPLLGGTGEEAPQDYLVVVADEDDTHVDMLSSGAVLREGEALPGLEAGASAQFTLDAGEVAVYKQIEPGATNLESDKPIGVWRMAGCALIPDALSSHQCDRAEQMLPPVRTLGAKYVAAPMRRDAADEPVLWRIIGVADGTELSYSEDVGGPATIDRGEAVWIHHRTPFVVEAQDSEHPFYLFNYLSTGDASPGLRELAGTSSPSGGSDFVVAVTPEQYLSSYTYFAEPGWDTSFVLVRLPADSGHEGVGDGYPDVRLDCGEGDAFVVTGWADIPGTDPVAQQVRVRLPGSCAGTVRVHGPSPFGMHAWGLSDGVFGGISAGVPAGMGLNILNDLEVLPEG